MYLIKIFSDFCSSQQCKNNYENIYHAFKMTEYGPNKKVFFTTGDVYTHAIIINQSMPNNLHVPKKNVIGLAFEPYELMNLNPVFIEYAKKHINKYYIGNKEKLPEPFVEGFSYMWFADPGRSITMKEKHSCMSIIISEKKYAPGHIYRHQLVETIIQNQLPIDIYGRGAHFYKDYNKGCIKGSFEGEIPYEKYLFSICIENFSDNHYFSEKIMSPLMYNCMPIYWGCKNILMYFDEVILLTGNLKADMNLLAGILKNPELFYKFTYNERNRKKINLIENVDVVFS